MYLLVCAVACQHTAVLAAEPGIPLGLAAVFVGDNYPDVGEYLAHVAFQQERFAVAAVIDKSGIVSFAFFRERVVSIYPDTCRVVVHKYQIQVLSRSVSPSKTGNPPPYP